MNSITLIKFEFTLYVVVMKFPTITIAIQMADLSRPIDVNFNIAFVFIICWRRHMKRINSIVWTGELTICCIESISNIVFNIFPNNWIYEVNLTKINI